MRSFACLSMLVALGFAAQSCMAVEKKSKVENEEEALRQEVTQMMTHSVQDGRTPVSGKFIYAKEDAENEKPLPKVIGYVNQKGAMVPIMVMNQSLKTILAQSDQKEVNVFGKYIDKGEKGKFLVVDDIALSAGGGAPLMKRKRGGL